MSRAVREFDSLVQEFYEGWFRFYPQAALTVGVSGYEGGLPVVDDDEIGALLSWLESMTMALQELDYHGLDDDRQLDVQLLFGACQEQYHLLMERDPRHRDPLRYLPGCGVQQLVLAPHVERSEALKKYLAAVPEYLRHARGQLATLPPLVPRFWVEGAICQGKADIEYLRGLKKSRLQLRGYENIARIHSLCDESAEALEGYLRFLEEEILPKAQGDIGCGSSRYLQLLRHRHFLPIDPDRLYDVMERAHRRALEELRVFCREQGDGLDPAAWLEAIAEDGWTSGQKPLEYAKNRCRSLRSFLQESNLIDLPPHAADLRCLEPAKETILESCISGYLEPVCGDPDLQGELYLKPNGIFTPEGVTAHCIRQGWSGRHLLYVSASGGTVSDNLLRRINKSPAMIGGWSLYAEQMLFEQGFDVKLELSLLRLTERVVRTRIALLDMEVHLQGKDAGEALQQLQELPGVSPRRAERELLQISRFPADAPAVVAGYLLISGLRESRERGADVFDLKFFHMRLLEQGVVPPPLLVKRVYGEQIWQELCIGLGFR